MSWEHTFETGRYFESGRKGLKAFIYESGRGTCKAGRTLKLHFWFPWQSVFGTKEAVSDVFNIRLFFRWNAVFRPPLPPFSHLMTNSHFPWSHLLFISSESLSSASPSPSLLFSARAYFISPFPRHTTHRTISSRCKIYASSFWSFCSLHHIFPYFSITLQKQHFWIIATDWVFIVVAKRWWSQCQKTPLFFICLF